MIQLLKFSTPTIAFYVIADRTINLRSMQAMSTTDVVEAYSDSGLMSDDVGLLEGLLSDEALTLSVLAAGDTSTYKDEYPEHFI